MLIYDIEIAKMIPSKDREPEFGLEYCAGFDDFANMGIALIGVHDYVADQSRLFGQHELEEFKELISKHDVLVGFNNIRFDNQLLAANGVNIPETICYDILVEMFNQFGGRRSGCKLGDVARVNFGVGKSGDGADAPKLWQKGFFGKVADYCLHDIRLTKKIVDRILRQGWIVNPINPERRLYLPRPNRKF
jgi:DEAD/DEAH box helicase domain-containing protein